MKVKELREALDLVDGELEIYTGTGDEYVNAVREEDVNIQEPEEGPKILTIQGQGKLKCFYIKQPPKVSKQAGMDVLVPLFRAYLHSLTTYQLLYKDSFENVLGDSCLGDEGELSAETWEALIEAVSTDWDIQQLDSERYNVNRKKVMGP